MSGFGRAKFKNKPKQDNPVKKQVEKKFQDGLKFDSPLELYTYNLLKENNINFEFKKKYTLMPTFSYAGDTVMGITLSVDFYLTDHDIILDPKGNPSSGTDIKWKLLKHQLFSQGLDPRICFVYSQKSARAFMEQLLNGFTDDIEDKYIATRIKKLRKACILVDEVFRYPTGGYACRIQDLKSMPNYDLYKILTHYKL